MNNCNYSVMNTGRDDAVFVLESPAMADFMEGRREGPLVTETLRTLGITHYAETVRNRNELRDAGSLFGGGRFKVLHVSAHGTDDGSGLMLTDNSAIPWAEFFETFPFQLDNGFASLSACSVLKGGLLEIALRRARRPPSVVIGPVRPITWNMAAVASVAVIQSLRNATRNDIAATLTGLFLMLGVDLHSVALDAQNQSTATISGQSMFELLARSLVRRDKTQFMRLTRDRGLLHPDESNFDWDGFWKKSDEAEERIKNAMVATDAVLGEGWDRKESDAE